jgi:hypothetical protein
MVQWQANPLPPKPFPGSLFFFFFSFLFFFNLRFLILRLLPLYQDLF